MQGPQVDKTIVLCPFASWTVPVSSRNASSQGGGFQLSSRMISLFCNQSLQQQGLTIES